MIQNNESVSLRRLFLFFIPLGISVLLINLSHVIINGTLARSDPSMQVTIIAGYALGMSLLNVTERPAVLMRQTCSALVRDRVSFRAVARVSAFVFGGGLLFGATVAYTPVGHWVFGGAFGADAVVERQAIETYYPLMFLSVFSGLRCLYQGIIIYKMKTRWLTIGMVFRLSGMFALSQYFLHTGVHSAWQGAAIFLFGMIIEAAISWLEARKLLKEMPEKDDACEVTKPRHVLGFYSPLLYSAFIVVWVSPIMNTLMGTTEKSSLTIASFATAGSLMNLMLGFFTYFHQIALQFFKSHPHLVKRFTLMLGFIPTVNLLIMCFTPVGPWMFSHVLGAEEELLQASIHALRGFLPLVLVFPWLDTLNGIVMSGGETKLMFGSQLANAVTTVTMIVVLSLALPGWNGVLGSMAQSIGVCVELLFLAWLFRRNHRTVK
ncbi:hypothetical protein [Cohnella panacarvi]|uniref:hypothetical protein n=1 Tax=Cohnella panacarvi TaxID=400776 RepID=UPI00047DB355|nr:hypothetical protein [Cohnella panacarvi]